MVDSLKNQASFSGPSGSGDSLRKNLKVLSPVSVSKGSEAAANARNASAAESAAKAVGQLTDSIKLSADALRSLRDAATGSVENREVAEENYDAATATPEDLEKVQQRAEDTGSAIQFRHDQALEAHGDGLNADTVYRLLSE